MNGLCTPLSPSQQEHSRPRGMCGTGVCRKKAPPGEKPVAEHAAAQEAPEKKSPQAPDLLPKRAEREGVQKKNSGIQVAETFLFPGKQKTFRRIAHSTGKKLAMEKEADQMRRIAHDTGKKKRPARAAWPE